MFEHRYSVSVFDFPTLSCVRRLVYWCDDWRYLGWNRYICVSHKTTSWGKFIYPQTLPPPLSSDQRYSELNGEVFVAQNINLWGIIYLPHNPIYLLKYDWNGIFITIGSNCFRCWRSPPPTTHTHKKLRTSFSLGNIEESTRIMVGW